MYAKIKFDNEKAEELYLRIQKALKEINECYFELRELGVVVLEGEKNEEKTSSVVREQKKSSGIKIALDEKELAEIIKRAIERVRTPH